MKKKEKKMEYKKPKLFSWQPNASMACTTGSSPDPVGGLQCQPGGVDGLECEGGSEVEGDCIKNGNNAFSDGNTLCDNGNNTFGETVTCDNGGNAEAFGSGSTCDGGMGAVNLCNNGNKVAAGASRCQAGSSP